MAQVNFEIDDTINAKEESACSIDSFYSDEHIAMLESRIADLKEKKNMHEHKLVDIK